MGVIPCLFIWTVIYRNILDRKITPRRIWIASLLSAVFSLQLGAFGVVLETLASGVTELPFFTFIGLMQPIHLAIGVVEGCITAAVLTFVWQMRPQLLEEALLLDHTCERYGRDSADDGNSDGAASASPCTAAAGAEENVDSSREKNTEKSGEKRSSLLKKSPRIGTAGRDHRRRSVFLCLFGSGRTGVVHGAHGGNHRAGPDRQRA